MTLPQHALKNLIEVHYGKPLKKTDRDEYGHWTVYGSSGQVGNHTNTLTEKPTIIIGRKGSVGEITFAPQGGWTIDTAFYTEILDVNTLDLRYLYYALKHARLASHTITTSIPGIHRDTIYNTKIPLPRLSEQKRIAAILDKADAIRRKRQTAISLADDILCATFIDMFGDPVTNPKGWREKQLDELISLQGGYAFKSSDYVDHGIPLIRIGNANKGEFDINNITYLPTSYCGKYSKYILEPGDMVITLTGTVGKEDYGNVTVIPNHYPTWFLNQRVAKITIKHESLLPCYLRFYLQHPWVKLNILKNSRGIRQANLNNQDILTQTIQIPRIDDQSKFQNIVENIHHSTTRMMNAINENNILFNALTQRAFQGKL